MEIIFKSSFLKSLKKIKNSILKTKIQETIIELEKVQKHSEISNLKKLSGYKTYYRIKIGDYRLGLQIENDTITLVDFQHRKDIYNLFP
ncbi:MAG: type II toxin-antitoxin system mRNA interferase toxin, RelE/StbE family [Bacteroidota bacterium]